MRASSFAGAVLHETGGSFCLQAGICLAGGPCFNEIGQCVGIAFQSLGHGEADGIGYVIPTPVINHFLTDYRCASLALAWHGSFLFIIVSQCFYNGDAVVNLHLEQVRSALLEITLQSLAGCVRAGLRTRCMTRPPPTAPAGAMGGSQGSRCWA